jgi:hypothetical protein
MEDGILCIYRNQKLLNDTNTNMVFAHVLSTYRSNRVVYAILFEPCKRHISLHS